MRYALLTLALLLGSTAMAAEEACSLVAPPKEAGEMLLQTGGLTVESRVFPRLTDLPRDYTGCQVLWASINGKATRTLIRIRSGRVEAVEPEPVPALCKLGERTAETGCTSRRQSLQTSFPSGCITRRVDGKYPPDCLKGFMSEHAMLDAWPVD
jgi:hypothetical protein